MTTQSLTRPWKRQSQSKAELVEITEEPISPETAIARVRDGSCGAVVAFIGSVRDFSSEGKKALFLENDISSKGIALLELQRVVDEIQARWQLGDVALMHRMGRLGVGDITLVVAVAAPHRKEAFEACQYAVDRFKQVVPAWETEITAGGEPG